MMSAIEKMRRDLEAIRASSPLVHNITNYVVMNNTANALLSIGASPVMAHAPEETAEMAAIAGALVVNIGTLSPESVEGMSRAMKSARAKGVPIVLDPVGAGATPYRDQVSARLINEVTPDIIRGNGSEIMALDSLGIKSKGVDSTVGSGDALESARRLSARTGAVVVISGKTDYIVDGEKVFTNDSGTPMMQNVTGLGCTASALCGAFAAVNPDRAEAALGAMILMGLCGEQALSESKGPGSFQVAFLDALFNFR